MLIEKKTVAENKVKSRRKATKELLYSLGLSVV